MKVFVNALRGREFTAIMLLLFITFNEGFCKCSQRKRGYGNYDIADCNFNETNVTRCDTLLVDVTPRLGWTTYICVFLVVFSCFIYLYLFCMLIILFRDHANWSNTVKDNVVHIVSMVRPQILLKGTMVIKMLVRLTSWKLWMIVYLLKNSLGYCPRHD